MQVPSVGRIVRYALTSQDAEEINRRRVNGVEHLEPWLAGAQAHVGNPVSTGAVVPMILTGVFPGPNGTELVNGQALLDGSDSCWATSVPESDEHPLPAGHWGWPARTGGA